ncbi:radical SAM protein [Candidatus Bathyarchaeota archaeon]|nr:MAG: radical SAM protein [Candidatus Bathyarchaeota archaeon]
MTPVTLPRFRSPPEAYCTCPPKFNINPYLGRCGHGCLYCYSVKFPAFRGEVKPRFELLERLKHKRRLAAVKLPVMLSDCTDPYQPIERKTLLTRRILELLVDDGFPILIVSKSDLVVRDLDLLAKTSAVVTLTVTYLDEGFTSFMEPGAPPPSKRIEALRRLSKAVIPVGARIDPIIPGLNDDPRGLKELVETLASSGVRHVTVSTLKPVRGFFKTLKRLNLDLYYRLRNVYSKGRWIHGYKYLPEDYRRRIVETMRSLVLGYGMSFASCRENLACLNTDICDGTGLIRKTLYSRALV